MTNEQRKRKYCTGCRDDFYNDKNPIGVKECWHFKGAKVVWRKIVPLDQRPPWNQKLRRVFNCFHPERAICVAPERTY